MQGRQYSSFRARPINSYTSTIERAQKLAWWDKEQSCGPVVEQATHFVDLTRYIAGEDNEYIPSSIKAISVENSEEAGHLSRLGIDESTIDTLNRIPRVTNAFWKHRKVRVPCVSLANIES